MERRELQQASRGDDRQHHSPEVGEAKKTSRSQWHVSEIWQPDDLADIVQSEGEQIVRKPERHEMLFGRGPAVSAAMPAVSTRGASGIGMACWLRLAIAALDVLGERRNFLNRCR